MYDHLPARTWFDDTDIFEVLSSAYHLKTSKYLRCIVCHNKIYQTKTREVFAHETEKVDNIYYILCVENDTCRELFQTTPQVYLINEGTEQNV